MDTGAAWTEEIKDKYQETMKQIRKAKKDEKTVEINVVLS